MKDRNEKISKKLKGIKRSPETLEKQSKIAHERFQHEPGTFKGKKHTDATKRKIAEKNGSKIGMYDKITGECLKIFISAGEASRWLIDNNKTTNLSAFTRILTICKHVEGQGKTAYGYRWEYLYE